VHEAVCHTGVRPGVRPFLKMSRPGQLQPRHKPTACDGTIHMIERATGCQLCIVRRSRVYLVQVICIAAAQPHAVCFSHLPVSIFGCPSTSSDPRYFPYVCIHVGMHPGTPRVRSKVCRSSKSSDGDIKTARAQELQSKARLLRKQQEELAEQLQRLDKESESLSATDKKLVQAELSSQVYKCCALNSFSTCTIHKCFPGFIAAY